MSEAQEQQARGLLCPVCKIPLAMSERQNIEVDYCPQCRGVWLDRGELDKVIERSAGPPLQGQPSDREDADSRGGRHGGHGGREAGHGRGGARRRSWLGEIFD